MVKMGSSLIFKESDSMNRCNEIIGQGSKKIRVALDIHKSCT